MKVGVEVEGRHRGIKTLFCDALEFADLTVEDVIDIKMAHQIEAIYISDHNNSVDLTDNNIFVKKLKSFLQMVTVERTWVDKDVAPMFDIFLVVESKAFWNLRDKDQIKFTKDLNVFAACKGLMYETTPDAFNGDKEI